jgi:hypothetical protein
MKRKDIGTVKRRDFLLSSAAFAGFGLPNLGWASVKPCPPTALSVSGGSSVSSSCQPGQLSVLTLAGGGPDKAWTFGQVFKPGDAPAYVTATGANSFQAEIRNRWSDGSVKFAVLSGIGGTSIQLGTTTFAPSAGEVPLVDPNASVTFSGHVTGTYNCPTSNTVASSFTKTAPHLVRKIAGPVMTERHYYVPTTDAHVAVWFCVRSYLNGSTEVETIIENGWLRVTSPGSRTYTATVRVGGIDRVTHSNVLHHHHTRWSRVDWVGANPGISPAHDAVYLKSTRLLLNPTVQSTPYSGRVTTENTTPFDRGDGPSSFGAAGTRGHWLSGVDIAQIVDPSAAKWTAVCGNARAFGRWPTHYRDEFTGLPTLAEAVSPLRVNQANAGGEFGAGKPETPLPTDGPSSTDQYFKWSHCWAAPYAHYLLSGRWSSMEEVIFLGELNWLTTGDNYRAPAYATRDQQDRSQAWALRSMAQAWTAAPDDWTQHKADLLATLERQIGLFYSHTQDPEWQNEFGIVWANWAYGYSPPKGNSWSQDYLSLAVLAAGDLGIGWTSQSQFNVVRSTVAKFPIVRAGDSTGWYFRGHDSRIIGGPNPVGWTNDAPSPWYTAAKSYAATLANKPAVSDSGPIYYSVSGQTLDPVWDVSINHNYFVPWVTALCLAKDAGISGATEALARVQSASNYLSVIVAQSVGAPDQSEPR